MLQSQECGNCDYCLCPDTTMEDRVVDAIRFLFCVAKTGQSFGMRQVIDVLRGANTEKIRPSHHDQLPIYGIGKGLSTDECLRLGRALLHQGLLDETADGYPILKLNPLSCEILAKKRSVEIATLVKPVQNREKRPAKTDDAPILAAGAEVLLQNLRALSKRIAIE